MALQLWSIHRYISYEDIGKHLLSDGMQVKGKLLLPKRGAGRKAKGMVEEMPELGGLSSGTPANCVVLLVPKLRLRDAFNTLRGNGFACN